MKKKKKKREVIYKSYSERETKPWKEGEALEVLL